MSSEKRYCENCGTELTRKFHGSTLEKLRDFKKRRFCDRQCAAGKNKPRERVELLTSGTTTKYKTALAILIEIMNDDNLGWNIRLLAAKAVLPYQSIKASARRGKKDEQTQKAQKASKGKFSSGKAPVVPFSRD